MIIKIYSRWDGTKVLFEREGATLREIVLAAVSSGANLYGANLYGANLYGANMSGANLYGANLYGANLSGANLSGANLYGANLYGANLYGANLYRANLYRADLSGANLYGADLSPIKTDLWDVLMRVPNEIGALVAALEEGRVNGSVYKDDSGCGCLVGTLAIAAHCNYRNMEFLKPNGARPAERWFLGIRKGDTPDKSNVVKITLEWIDEFQTLLNRAVELRSKVSQ